MSKFFSKIKNRLSHCRTMSIYAVLVNFTEKCYKIKRIEEIQTIPKRYLGGL